MTTAGDQGSRGTVVLVHGLWTTPHSWRHWADRYTAAGYSVHAPGWPGVAALSGEGAPDRAARDVGVREVADHYEGYIRSLPEHPIIIGHSFGGLVTQILLDRGLGCAGVAVHPAQPRGVLRLPPSVLKATWPVLGHPANLHKAVALSDPQFHYAFANTVSPERAAAERARWAVPAPARPLFQAAFANVTPTDLAETRVDYGNPRRAPLLLIAGGADHLVPASVVRENHRRYAGTSSHAVTEYTEFPGRDHLTVALDGWEQVADRALAWAEEHRAVSA